MTQILMLDAAFPPDPGSLIADITTVGAQGAFLYVWGPFVNGSPAHVIALQRAGLHVAPIIVPGDFPPVPDAMIATVRAWGFQNGPIFFDFERGSDPGKAWFDNAEGFFHLHGYHAEPYGTISVLGQYDPDDKDWVANWLRTGILDPIPQLPDGWEDWQFVNDININGHQYDASVVSLAILDPIPQLPDGWEDWQFVNDININGRLYDASVVSLAILAGEGVFTQMVDGFKVGLAHTIIKSIYQREPTQQELFDLANTINADGSNLADLVQGLVTNTQNPDLAPIQNQALNTALQAVATHLNSLTDADLKPALKQAFLDIAAQL